MSDRLIDDYLRELKVSAWIVQLTPAETAELQNEVRERIEQELDAAGNRDEETVYRVFDKLGAPGDQLTRTRDGAASNGSETFVAGLTPVARLQSRLRRHGWGLAEIGALVLLIAGPFLLWWIGPIFGIILVRMAAERWSDRSMRVATTIVAALFSVQVLITLTAFVFVLINGGSLLFELQRIASRVMPIGEGGPGIFGGSGGLLGLLSRSPFEIMLILLAPIAGVSSGIYLALSPRYRRKRSRCLRPSPHESGG